MKDNVKVGDIFIRNNEDKDYIVSNIDYNQIYLTHVENNSRAVTGIVILKNDLNKLFTKKERM